MTDGILEWAGPHIARIVGDTVPDEVIRHICTIQDSLDLADFLSSFSSREEAYSLSLAFAKELNERKRLAEGPPPSTKEAIGEIVTPPPTRQVLAKSRKTRATTRSLCHCNASDHALIGNCIACGKIICSEEGDGPCLFCGNDLPALTPTSEATINYKSTPGYEKATSLTSRLVDYDKDAARRMHVWDMETDFYAESLNPWTSDKDRTYASEMAAKKEHNREFGHRLLGELIIDLETQSMTISDLQKEFEKQCNEQLENFLSMEGAASKDRSSDLVKPAISPSIAVVKDSWEPSVPSSTANFQLVNKNLSGAARDVYNGVLQYLTKQERRPLAKRGPNLDSELVCSSRKLTSARPFSIGSDFNADDLAIASPDEPEAIDVEYCRQDFEIDDGICITLHQPWASLLACGFKRLEGREWQTTYRGRLWIHAAAQEPDPILIIQLSSYYSKLYGNKHPPLPTVYPTSALIGCVDMIDCIPATELSKAFDEGRYTRNGSLLVSRGEQNDSPYVFVCKAPRVLVVPIHIRGNRRLWELPKARLNSLQRSLREVRWGVIAATAPIADASPPPAPTLTRDHPPAFITSYISALYAESGGERLSVPALLAKEVICDGAIVFPKVLLPSTMRTTIIRGLFGELSPTESALCYCDQSAGYARFWGLRYDSQLNEYVGYDCDGVSLNAVPHPVAEYLRSILERTLVGAGAGFSASRSGQGSISTKAFSIGGPHLPTVDSLQLVAYDSAKLLQTLIRDPFPGPVGPTIICCLAGSVKMLLDSSSPNLSSSSQTRESVAILNKLQEGGVRDVSLEPGHALCVANPCKVRNLRGIGPTSPSVRPIAERSPCALFLVGRFNCW